jgi:hypothetical protein
MHCSYSKDALELVFAQREERSLPRCRDDSNPEPLLQRRSSVQVFGLSSLFKVLISFSRAEQYFDRPGIMQCVREIAK